MGKKKAASNRTVRQEPNDRERGEDFSAAPLRGFVGLPGLTSTDVPPQHRDHPLVHGRFFFTIPHALLGGVEDRLGDEALGELRSLEWELSAVHESHAFSVGFWDTQPVPYQDLEAVPASNFPLAGAREVGLANNAAQLQLRLRRGLAQVDRINSTIRGYVGWLITHPLFAQEQRELLERWQSEVVRWGTAGVGRILLSAGVPPHSLSLSPSAEFGRPPEYDAAMREFLIRWRLLDLAAPGLPTPMKPMLAGAVPVAVLPQLVAAGGLFNIPDTYPVPSRDELRNLIDSALATSRNVAHLAEWHELIRAGNAAKARIARFARIRQLVHYWRLLHARHGERLLRRRERLREAFRDYFKISDDAIKEDLKLIRRRLGNDWEQQTPSPLC